MCVGLARSGAYGGWNGVVRKFPGIVNRRASTSSDASGSRSVDPLFDPLSDPLFRRSANASSRSCSATSALVRPRGTDGYPPLARSRLLRRLQNPVRDQPRHRGSIPSRSHPPRAWATPPRRRRTPPSRRRARRRWTESPSFSRAWRPRTRRRRRDPAVPSCAGGYFSSAADFGWNFESRSSFVVVRAPSGEAAVLQPGVDRADRVGFTRVQERAAGPIAQDSRHLVQEPRRERVCTSRVRSIYPVTCLSSFGSLHAPRHATAHMCALSDTTLGPKSCVRSVGHASRATHGENVRIVSPSQWAHSAAVARHASAWTAGCGSARARARDAEHVWKRRTTVAASSGRPDGPAGVLAGSPASFGASSPRSSPGMSASGRRAARRGRASESRDRPADRPGSFQRPSQRAQAVRSRLVVAGVCNTGGRDRVERVTGRIEACAAGAARVRKSLGRRGEGGARTELGAEPVQSHGGEDIVIALLDRPERVRLLLVAHVGARRQ